MRGVSNPWQEKIDRAKALITQSDAAAEILRFYADIVGFQETVYSALDDRHRMPEAMAAFIPGMLALMATRGTFQLKQIADFARELEWADELSSYWKERVTATYTPISLISQSILQPFARKLATTVNRQESWLKPECPVCGCLPQLAVLRPEGDGAKRHLLCGLCRTEWEYRRVICVYCGELDKEKLPVFTNELTLHVRTSGCDTCRRYLKCVDLSVDGHAVPEVEDIATLAVSVWMIEQGFQPIRANLFGF
ncbi:Uncharacterized protein involved in formate dehydrogenase formation [Candidatus Koribacter versatilis Ellin345]|uniref:Uncharacterized protein involved in formate dehydrogenase formation n=1 Tax=Koribacter versatilis (strain Ellin345) TaxID=204669 RepID=Q1ITC6_KORVE|nr:formate dehydrogenase accessory protein FdhE [Candidatus Koribacter versatilis]ABF39874.1 Uncharacterized protein involved in formate dehydrogenase formation [Candidatus Koribacter versatilis Ellin345]